MIQIHQSDQVPDTTYFRTGDVEPDINDAGSITIYNGEGTRRSSWGAPAVTSTVIYKRPDFVAIHVGWYHKHGGGQTWRYYRQNGDGTKRLTWSKIDDDLRAEILDAYEENAPNWARVPGKLRKNYKKPDPKANAFVGYKIVRITDDDTMISLYDPDVIYKLGKTKIERSQPNHNGGWYVYPDAHELTGEFLAGRIYETPQPGRYALLECECWGNREYYDQGGNWMHDQDLEWFGPEFAKKISVTYCKPLGVLQHIEVEE